MLLTDYSIRKQPNIKKEISLMGAAASSDHADDVDVESFGSLKKLESIEASVGWIPFPKVKLASWNPDDERQWKVSAALRVDVLVLAWYALRAPHLNKRLVACSNSFRRKEAKTSQQGICL